MKSAKNYMAAYGIYLLMSLYSVICKGASLELEAHYCYEVAMTLLLAWLLQKETPLKIELTVTRGAE